jgi:hypothetical protein
LQRISFDEPVPSSFSGIEINIKRSSFIIFEILRSLRVRVKDYINCAPACAEASAGRHPLPSAAAEPLAKKNNF